MNPIPNLHSRFSNYSTEADPDDAASSRLMHIVREELNASLSVIYSEECPLPEEIRDPWLQRVVDMSSFFDNLQTKHRSLRTPWSSEETVKSRTVYEQTLNLGKEIERDRRLWLNKISGLLFRKKTPFHAKPHLMAETTPHHSATLGSRDKALPPRPHTADAMGRSSPPRRSLRRTPALRELSGITHPIDVTDAKSASAESLSHRRIVSDPHPHKIISPQPRKPIFNPFLGEVQGSVTPSEPSERALGTSTPSCSGESSSLPLIEVISSRYTASPFRASSDSSSLSSLEYTTAPTTPRIMTPRTRSPMTPPKRYQGLTYDETGVYYSPLDHLRLYPRLDPHGRAPHTPEQAVLSLSPKRHASPVKAQTVTVRGRYQSLRAAKVTHSMTPNECRCKRQSKLIEECSDDIAFLPNKPRLLKGEGYFHSKLVDETETEEGDTVQTWGMVLCNRCNRQSRPPARDDVISMLSSNPDDCEAYSITTEDFDETLGY